jgi:hypothetical protein
MFIFGGIHAGLSWIPADWGVHDEDGEWSPYRDSLSALFSVWGTIMFSYFLLGHCRLKLKEQSREAAETSGGAHLANGR